MISQRFLHNGIWYEFKWAKRESLLNLMPSDLATQLSHFFERIYNKNIPMDLFDNPKITRCSKFRVKGLKRGMQKTLSDILIKKSLVLPFSIGTQHDAQIHSSFLDLLTETQECYAEYHNLGYRDYKPSHDVVLSRILLKNEQALAIETPVWTRKQSRLTDFMTNPSKLNFTCGTSLTGHIDLLLYNPQNRVLVVCDYKPEGFFLRSLPQVATYGLLLKRILKIPEIQCISFSKDEGWYYNPEILHHQLESLLQENGNPTLKWRKLIRYLKNTEKN